MIDTERRIEKRHKLTTVKWHVVAKPRTCCESTSTTLLYTFGFDQVRELFGETEETTLTLKPAAYNLLNQYLSAPIEWNPKDNEYELVQVNEQFELLEASAPKGELESAIRGIFDFRAPQDKWCLLILAPYAGGFDDHEASPIFWFQTADWATKAAPVIIPYTKAMEPTVHHYLPKLKFLYMYAFLDARVLDDILDGAVLSGKYGHRYVDETAKMLTGKIAHMKANLQESE